ncbi:MAG: LysM peptidoglycan-binding domain-containing protein [Bacteroidetes bacterium]|jgi:nucleoid-associated protein YgaU|nr:LysM peptidoglycan-binding domain-containing protein [Bacteroidota bacterium]
MSLQDKYQPVLNLGEDLGVQDGYVQEEDGVLKIGGVAQTPYEKDLLWNKIKEIGGEAPADLEADIKVANADHYHEHVVESGDTLGGIAKTYYGASGKYMQIFEANRDQLDNPDLIKVGQTLTIPFPE